MAGCEAVWKLPGWGLPWGLTAGKVRKRYGNQEWAGKSWCYRQGSWWSVGFQHQLAIVRVGGNQVQGPACRVTCSSGTTPAAGQVQHQYAVKWMAWAPGPALA